MVLSMAIGNWYHSISMFIGHHVVAISITFVVAMLVAIGIRNRGQRNPRIRGAALTGRARILSVEQIGGEEQVVLLRIGLRVEVPGHTPYDVTVKRRVQIIHVARVQTGATFPVQVDATNLQKVGIDFNQPVPPPG